MRLSTEWEVERKGIRKGMGEGGPVDFTAHGAWSVSVVSEREVSLGV